MADESDSVPVGEGRAPRIPKVAKVKNKAPAPLQITAEQLLREAKERQLEIVPAPPKQKIQDADELADYQVTPEIHVNKDIFIFINLITVNFYSP
jgi:hypothetical protein